MKITPKKSPLKIAKTKQELSNVSGKAVRANQNTNALAHLKAIQTNKKTWIESGGGTSITRKTGTLKDIPEHIIKRAAAKK